MSTTSSSIDVVIDILISGYRYRYRSHPRSIDERTTIEGRDPPPIGPPTRAPPPSSALAHAGDGDGDGDGDCGVLARDDDDDIDAVVTHGVDDDARTTEDKDDVVVDDAARARATRTTRTTRGEDDDGVGRERGFSRVGSRDEEPEAYGY